MLEIFLLMVNVKESKSLNDEIKKYRDDYKYAKEHKLIPKISYPNSLKTNCKTSEDN